MKKIVVLGYGAVGREVAALLTARGDDVVVAQRTAPKQLRSGVAFKPCDLTRPELVAAACAGRQIAVCAVGFKYDSRVWERAWPAAMNAMLNACEAAGARLVFADNLYMLGPQPEPLTEDMPLTSYGRKPRVRSEITRLWQRAHADGRVKAVAVRASDFYGPDVPTSVLSALGVARLVAGRPALVPYCPDFPHDFTYVPDFARARDAGGCARRCLRAGLERAECADPLAARVADPGRPHRRRALAPDRASGVVAVHPRAVSAGCA